MEPILHPDLFGGESPILPDPDLMPEAYAEPGEEDEALWQDYADFHLYRLSLGAKSAARGSEGR